jgi:hypothetical protein
MAVLGAIEIQMLADLARLRQDMQQAKGIVGDAAASMQGAFSTAGKALGLLGVGLSGAAFTGWIKGAVDAADEANKMAQKIGITTDKVAGLQLAFEQSGAGGPEVMQKAMSKLSVELVNGNKTLAALGITTRDSREALAQLADRFQKMPEGIDKSAAAAGVFGERIGANMIPLLNAGRKGLDEMDKAARDLGLSIDSEFGAAAESFNDNMDLVREGARGAALGIAGELMPALSALAKEMAEASKNGGAFAGLGESLSVGLEAVVVIGSEVGFVIRGIVREVMMLAGQAKALASLDFAEEKRIYDAAKAEAQADRDRTDAFNRRILQARAIAESVRNAADLDEPRLRRAIDEGNKALAARNGLLGQQADAAKKAAAEAKKLADAENDRISRRGLGELRRFDEAAAEDARLTEVHNKAVQAEKELRAAQELAAQARYQAAEDAADDLYRKEVETARKAQEEIQRDWQKGVDQMGQSLADALMTGGKNAADYLMGLFRTLVLRPVLMPGAAAMSAGVANAATGSGGASGALNIGSLFGGVGTFGAAAGAGVGATMGGAGLGSILGGAGAMMGQGTMAGITGGLGLGIGAIAPYAAAAYALYAVGKKLFSKKLDDAGITGTFSGSGFSGQSFENYSRIIGGDSSTKKALSTELDAVFDAGALAARESVKAYADALGLPVKAIEGITQKIKFSTKGQSAEETAAEIERFVGKYAETLASAYAPALKQFQKVGESVGDTLQRLAGLQTFSDTLADLGGVFQRVAGLSVDAREGFIAMAGGMDALGQKAMAFVQEYYNRDEIAGIKAAEIKQALEAVGITQDVNSRDDFRKLVDGLDVSTQRGQEQLAALLDMAAGFTQVADYIAEIGGTLSGVAGQSPSTGAAAALFGPGGQGEQQIMAINNVSYWTELVYNAVKELTGVVAGGSSTQTSAAPRRPEVNGGSQAWEST